MPSICGLDPAGWQETCDLGRYFWPWGWGCMASQHWAMDRQLGRPVLLLGCCRVPGMTPAAPHSCPEGSLR